MLLLDSCRSVTPRLSVWGTTFYIEFIKKAFRLLIAIEHYTEVADPALKEAVQTAEKDVTTAKRLMP